MRTRTGLAALLGVVITTWGGASSAGEAILSVDQQIEVRPTRGLAQLSVSRREEFFLKHPRGRSLILVLECDQPHRLQLEAAVNRHDTLQLGRGLALRYDAPGSAEVVRLPVSVASAAPLTRYRVRVFDAHANPTLWREIEAEAAAWAILGP